MCAYVWWPFNSIKIFQGQHKILIWELLSLLLAMPLVNCVCRQGDTHLGQWFFFSWKQSLKLEQLDLLLLPV